MTENDTPLLSSPELSNRSKAVVTAGLEEYNHLVDRCEKAEADANELRVRIAGYKVAAEADRSRVLDLESRAKTLQFERDQEFANRVKWEGLFIQIRALLRAFNIPNEPLIKDHSDEFRQEMDPPRGGAQTKPMAQQQIFAHRDGDPYPPMGGVFDRVLGGASE